MLDMTGGSCRSCTRAAGLADRGEQRYEHLGSRERTVPADEAIGPGVDGIDERVRALRHQGDIAEPAARHRRDGRAEPALVDDLLLGTYPRQVVELTFGGVV